VGLTSFDPPYVLGRGGACSLPSRLKAELQELPSPPTALSGGMEWTAHAVCDGFTTSAARTSGQLFDFAQ